MKLATKRHIFGLLAAMMRCAVVLLGTGAQMGFGGMVAPDGNTVVLDRFESSTVGVPHGPISFAPGAPGLGNAILLGAGAYVQYPVPGSLETQGTIEMWINPNAANGSILNFNWLDTGSYPPAGHVLHLGLVNWELSIGGWAWNPAEMYPLTSGMLVPVGQWSHIALSWGVGARLYVNGSLAASSAQPWRPASPAWGYLNYWGDAGLGLVDELHISDVQRTGAEIAEHASPIPEPATWLLIGAGMVVGAMRSIGPGRRRLTPSPHVDDPRGPQTSR